MGGFKAPMWAGAPLDKPPICMEGRATMPIISQYRKRRQLEYAIPRGGAVNYLVDILA